MNSLLSIAVPTYNRASILVECLKIMAEELRLYNIPIYISDDSNNEDTQIMIQEFGIGYPNVFYFRNSPSLGHDKNCLHVLQLPQTKYIWYLNDSSYIKNGGIGKILNLLKGNDFSFVAVNCDFRDLDITDRVFDNPNVLLESLGWHLTQTGVTIYSKEVINSVVDIDLGECRNFPQTAIIFSHFAKVKSRLFWVNERLISTSPKKVSYWSSKVFDVFLCDWTNFIENLGVVYQKDAKYKASIDHSKRTNLFSIRSLLSYRSLGAYNMDTYKKYKNLLKLHSSLPASLLFIIALIPKKVLLIIKKLFNLSAV